MSAIASAIEPFFCGGLAGVIASSIAHPIDLSKVRLQLFATQNPGVPSPGFIGILSQMIRKNGISSIYDGLSAAILRQCIYGTTRMGIHRTLSDAIQKSKGGKHLNPVEKVGAGMAAGFLGTCVGTPLDVTLVRMQADSMKASADRRNYRNVFDALFRIIKEEGFSTLYRGLGPNLFRGMAINVGQLAGFDQAKEFIHANIMKEPEEKKASKATQVLAAGCAGVAGTCLALPFDLIKSRIQDSSTKIGVLRCAVNIYKTEGLLAFWTGFIAFYGRTGPHSMILLISVEPITQFYRQVFDLQQK